MSRLAALCLVVACTSVPPTAVDAPTADASGAIDAPPDTSCAPLWQDLYACSCCSEGDYVCVDVVVASSSIADVVANTEHPPRDEVVACVRARAIGRCFSGETTVCAAGI